MEIKTLKDLVETFTTTPTSTTDAKIFLIAASESLDYFNAVTNTESKDLFKFMYNTYLQSPVFKEAIDLLRAQIDTDLHKQAPVGEKPVNTNFKSTAADDAVKKALEELGGIYTGINKNKS